MNVNDESHNGDEFASLDELAPSTQNQSANQQAEANPIPEKYRGKSVDDLLKIVQDQEKFIGRQAEEVGFARKMAEEASKLRQSVPVNNEPAKVNDDLEDVDFFADPKNAIKKAVESHPEVQRAKQLAMDMRREQVQSRIKQLHPDVDTIAADPEFAQWVQGNKARMQLLQMAENNFDADAADELLNNFKTQKRIRQAETENQTQELTERKNDALKAAQVDSGTRPDAGKKFLRRADIIDLMKNNPARYAALQDEIMRAYAEGRVR